MTRPRRRMWLAVLLVAATVGGTLLGGAAAWWLTRDRSPASTARDRSPAALRATPFGGVVGGIEAPAYGLGVRGTW